MNSLLNEVLTAHGGLKRWNEFNSVEATIVTGGTLWGMKGLVQDPAPRRMTVSLHDVHASVRPFGGPNQRTYFTPNRIAIETDDCNVVAERQDPRASFEGHGRTTPWDPLQRAYFNGYALWTYLTTPFLLNLPGVKLEEMRPWVEGDQVWRVLRATFPSHIPTHSTVQDFYFGADFLLRRHDYTVDIADGLTAAQLVNDYTEVQGLGLPTKRRAYYRGRDGRPTDTLLVSIDLSDVHFSRGKDSVSIRADASNDALSIQADTDPPRGPHQSDIKLETAL
ncbi:hypothetical protein [Candidatus Phyllobacterium onerii]|uniref:hypothetical protein n=1 Tax=Candidatus Phyllobacterium onerii TaxID=3020828 RepID=UPI002330485C|nr:hypothetical protein [Phyllobacterium sp. IY22]